MIFIEFFCFDSLKHLSKNGKKPQLLLYFPLKFWTFGNHQFYCRKKGKLKAVFTMLDIKTWERNWRSWRRERNGWMVGIEFSCGREHSQQSRLQHKWTSTKEKTIKEAAHQTRLSRRLHRLFPFSWVSGSPEESIPYWYYEFQWQRKQDFIFKNFHLKVLASQTNSCNSAQEASGQYILVTAARGNK